MADLMREPGIEHKVVEDAKQPESLSTEESDRLIALLPHDYPMVLVDRVESITQADPTAGLAESIETIKVVSQDEFWMENAPGGEFLSTLLQEAVQQSAAILVMAHRPDLRGLPMVAVIEEMHFGSPVRAGDIVRMRVEIAHVRGIMFKFTAQATVGDRTVLEGRFTGTVGQIGGTAE